ncbi:flagellar basal body P-ring formation chaperone FlgA [Vogesella sp. LIG4]|uniref:flagellar basal body P-ring formation chaperone FlgA n=1 Tax=Vogesella sp. LIG4 TaxID=1192162 RepID=UPI00081F88E3|nr:flagellar basal body P-ring formation chaperone FlgA [Vogesella sp. LIG4]SCK17583.1 flagella basal body P-ring formation protein FlgA [Vogesella sp. LIG4]
MSLSLTRCGVLAALLLPLPLLAAPQSAANAQTEEAARRYLADYAGRQHFAAPQISVQALPAQRPLPPCGQPFAVTPADTRNWQRMRFSLRCPDSTASSELVVRAEMAASVLVARQDIPAGQAIDAAAVGSEVRNLSATPDAIGDIALAAERTARRTIRSGQVLQLRALQPQLLVQRGQTVQILARQGGIEVSVPGEALQAGARDEQIRVRNLASKRIISAVVLDAGSVAPVDTAIP